jgi:hypothetical protein
MAHVWSPHGPGGEEWWARPLDEADAFVLSAGSLFGSARTTDAGAALLLRSRSQQGDSWLVLSAGAGDVALNGNPIATGIHLLRDRDELLVKGVGRVFFSTERVAQVETARDAGAAMCPRCLRPVEVGQRVVVCPRCAVQVHCMPESEDIGDCWNYSEQCPTCNGPTGLGGSFDWSPAVL